MRVCVRVASENIGYAFVWVPERRERELFVANARSALLRHIHAHLFRYANSIIRGKHSARRPGHE